MVTTAVLKRRGNTRSKQRRLHVRWIGFYWVLPELVRTVKRGQTVGVGFTKYEVKGGVGSKHQVSDVASIAEQLQVMKHTISELVSSKNNPINSKPSEVQAKG